MLIKKLIFKAMRLVQFDFNITHHWVSEHKMRVHSFQHKNYWWHGKNRERSEMLSIKKLLKTGDTVIEIGGHIGYISVYMSNLVGKNGSVHVFEPGGNNYRYIKNNTENLENITLEKMAVSELRWRCGFFC